MPAGKFKAVRVAVEVTAAGGPPPGGPEQLETWYAPDVGLIKSTLNGKDIQVLKSFSPGKK